LATGGIITVLLWIVFGIVFCLTIIVIPFGIQCFRNAGFALAPFGRDVISSFHDFPIVNILWRLIGTIIAMLYLIIGIVFCLTIVLIPFGIQWFKMAYLAFTPFGAEFD
jgi:uncharacterized membrane protein YccF (DUF307 family)